MRGSIRDNLTIGRPKATDEDVSHAVEICQLTPLVTSLREGLETPVAEWGATLSGGQRQRFAIARAILRDTPILLLDEATANIDVTTEEAMLAALFKAYRGRTILFVTHRVASTLRADQVCVLESGRVTGVGAPKTLASTHPTYARLLAAAGAGIVASPLTGRDATMRQMPPAKR